jgi:hypothetical protein
MTVLIIAFSTGLTLPVAADAHIRLASALSQSSTAMKHCESLMSMRFTLRAGGQLSLLHS